jgi:hypothetical protein
MYVKEIMMLSIYVKMFLNVLTERLKHRPTYHLA